MATRTASTRSRSTATKRAAPRKRAAAPQNRAPSLTDDAKTAVRSVRNRATRAVRKVPTDGTTLSIAAGVVAGIVAAGVAIFMNRDSLRSVAAEGSERLKKAADDISTMAHERIDQARDNITKFRSRDTAANAAPTATDPVVVNG